MEIKVFKTPLSLAELSVLAKSGYGDMVKGVVDVTQGIVALGGELHADAEEILLDQGCKQEDLWGFNIYPAKSRNEWLEYTSMINIRPRQGNRSREVQDGVLRDKIKGIVEGLIK